MDSWNFQNHNPWALSVSQNPHGVKSPQGTIHRPCRCLGGSQVTICRACQCLESSRNALKSRSIVPVGVWRPPGWLLDVFGSATSSPWKILEALGGSRSSQNQDSSALSVSGRLTSHDLSCLSVSGGPPACFEVSIYRAWRCLEASRNAMKSRSIVPCRCSEAFQMAF